MRFCCRRFVKAVRDGAITIGDENGDTLAKPDVERVFIQSRDYSMYSKYCPFCGKEITFEFEEDEMKKEGKE